MNVLLFSQILPTGSDLFCFPSKLGDPDKAEHHWRSTLIKSRFTLFKVKTFKNNFIQFHLL